MAKVTVRGILKTLPNGNRAWAGYVPLETPPPDGVLSSEVEVLDPEDNTPTVWVLAFPDRIPLLDETALETLRAGELARAAKAKLSDAELAALGLTRDG